MATMKQTLRRLVLGALFAVPAPAALAERLVLSGADILTMDDAGPVSGQVLLIMGDQIEAMVPAEQYSPRASDRVLDLGGGTLIPGLIDAHVHIDHPQDLEMLALYGVTAAINMRGLPWHLWLRDQIRSGVRFAPDFLTSGDYLDGDPPDMLPMASVAGAEAARSAVARFHDLGYDFIKIYSELTLDQYEAICQEAGRRAMAVLGHLPDALGLEDVTECPQRNIAHGEQLFKLLENRKTRKSTAPCWRLSPAPV